jgi:hypothetical protein
MLLLDVGFVQTDLWNVIDLLRLRVALEDQREVLKRAGLYYLLRLRAFQEQHAP